MRVRIEINALTPNGSRIQIAEFPLNPEGDQETSTEGLGHFEITDLVLSRVRDYVTHELL